MRPPDLRGLALFLLLTLIGCRAAPTTEPNVPDASVGWLLVVQESGPRWLGPDWWRTQGLDSKFLNSQQLCLSSNGESVGFLWLDSPTGPGLLFLGQARSSHLGPIGAYTLTMHSSEADHVLPSLTSEPSPPFQTDTRVDVWLEKDRIYRTTAPLDPPWLWTSLNAPTTLTLTIPLTAALSMPVTLTLRVWGQSHMPQNPDHHIRVWWNGTMIDDHLWDGSDVEVWTIVGPMAQAGGNILVLEAPGDTGAPVDVTWLDAIGVTWQATMMGQGADWERWHAADESTACWSDLPDGELRALLVDAQGVVYESAVYRDQADENAACIPQMLQAQGWIGVPWEAPLPDIMRLRQTLTSTRLLEADYLMIAPDTFHDELSPLIKAREQEGLSVAVVSPQQIYDTYGSGIPDGEAIRKLVLDVQSRGHLRYVLLVGDTSADPREMWVEDVVPTLWERTIHIGATPSDWALVANEVGEPVAAIGRLPVSTVVELKALVTKTLAWTPMERLLVLADNESEFAEMSDALAGVYTPDLRLDAGQDSVRRDLIRWLKAAPGFLIYSGHGSLPMLGNEKLLSFEDAGVWTGPTIVAAWTCLCANYTHPQQLALSEVWLRNPRGAVAFVGPTGETTTAEQSAMALAFQKAVVNGERLGDALLVGWRVAQSQDARVGFLLLGDPALQVFPGEVQ